MLLHWSPNVSKDHQQWFSDFISISEPSNPSLIHFQPIKTNTSILKRGWARGPLTSLESVCLGELQLYLKFVLEWEQNSSTLDPDTLKQPTWWQSVPGAEWGGMILSKEEQRGISSSMSGPKLRLVTPIMIACICWSSVGSLSPLQEKLRIFKLLTTQRKQDLY